jgi:uncharacterized protein (TIGR02145 family)
MKTFLTTLFIVFSAISFSQTVPTQEKGTFTDSHDGHVYKWVKIGNQIWMAENLNVNKFRNGDPIPEIKTDIEWIEAREKKQPAWCYYANDLANGVKYGRLYNWFALNDPRGLAPKGWHISNNSEWKILINFLGGENVAGKKMKSTSGWNHNGNGTNISGFSAIPSGVRRGKGSFGIGDDVYWWSCTEEDEFFAWCHGIMSILDIINSPHALKSSGFSVRCLRD